MDIKIKKKKKSKSPLVDIWSWKGIPYHSGSDSGYKWNQERRKIESLSELVDHALGDEDRGTTISKLYKYMYAYICHY